MEDPSQGGRVQGGSGMGNGSDLGASGATGSGSSARNDSSSTATTQMLNMVNLATMSDSQFRESLDALLGDNFSAAPTASPPLVADAIPTTELIPTLPEFPCTTSFGTELGTLLPDQPLVQQQQLPNLATTADFMVSQSSMPPSQPQPQTLGSVPVAMMPPPPTLSQLQFLTDPNTGMTTMMPSNMFPPNFIMPQQQLQQQQPFGMTVQATTSTYTPQQQQPVLAQPVPSIALPNLPNNMPMAGIPTHVSLPQVVGPPPATVISSMSSTSTPANLAASSSKKRARPKSTPPASQQKAQSDLASMDINDFRKRRADRNAREQQRAQQVTDQIALLRSLLEQSGVSLNKTDKFSTLIMVEKYIRSLQVKSAQLAADHQQLLLAMSQTNDHVNNMKNAAVNNERATPQNVCSSSGSGSDDASNPSSQDSEEEGLPAVKGINYKWIFNSCPFPVAIASIDGRFMEINKEFEELTCYSRNELLPLERHGKKKLASSTSSAAGSSDEAEPENAGVAVVAGSGDGDDKKCNMSIFNILHRDCIERLFCPMSKILQLYNNDEDDEDNGDDSTSGSGSGAGDDNSGDKDTIAQDVQLCKRSGRKAKMRVTLVRSSKGLPRFFYCVLIPIQETPSLVSQFG